MSNTWTIASWNVNSIKVRQEQLAAWLAEQKIDVVALQETKVEDSKFPHEIWQDLGYTPHFFGQKTYNGVALLSKYELTNIETHILDFPDTQARTISGVLNDTLIVNLYVPNGSTRGSDKFIYKLKFLDSLQRYLAAQLKQYSKVVVLGDFNIAPRDEDVHDPIVWQDSVLTCPEVRTRLEDILNIGFIDCFQSLNKQEVIYSWWDYRQAAFRRNMGLRIDLILASTSLFESCGDIYIDKEPRKNERPSDHTPVVAEFSFS
ncbi:MAG: exodeoxyribonuclease III [Pseudomonadota bacterium]|nr:exodeoxyribonuclease III [Pseudomonadota bacterium]